MFFSQKSGRKPAAHKQCHNDELSKELASAAANNVNAAENLERLLSTLLDTKEQLQQRTYHFNAPSLKS